jgi:hypothetical protein
MLQVAGVISILNQAIPLPASRCGSSWVLFWTVPSLLVCRILLIVMYERNYTGERSLPERARCK